jgi:nitroreductase
VRKAPISLIEPCVLDSQSRFLDQGRTLGNLARDPNLAESVGEVIRGRQHVGPRRLGLPAPDANDLEKFLQAAASAPDHGRITPWRFVLVPNHKRYQLADAFAEALIDRDPSASADEIDQAKAKAFNGPMLMLAVVKLTQAETGISKEERLISLGCAIQNMLLMSHAMGYACGLSSGKALGSSPLRTLFGLGNDEEATCFLSFGTARDTRPPRERPQPAHFFEQL